MVGIKILYLKGERLEAMRPAEKVLDNAPDKGEGSLSEKEYYLIFFSGFKIYFVLFFFPTGKYVSCKWRSYLSLPMYGCFLICVIK